MLIGAYGVSTQRPLIRTGTEIGMIVPSGTRNDNFALVGLHLWANLYTEARAFREDCRCSASARLPDRGLHDRGFETNLVVQGASEFPGPTGRHKNVAIRRCVIADAYTTGASNSEGIFASGRTGCSSKRTSSTATAGRTTSPGSEPTWFRHNIYIQNLNTDVVLRGNIVARTDGLHTRSGGLVEENLILNNALGMVLGGGGFPAIEADGVEVMVRRKSCSTGTISRRAARADGGCTSRTCGRASSIRTSSPTTRAATRRSR
jgi:hypothetical protein